MGWLALRDTDGLVEAMIEPITSVLRVVSVEANTYIGGPGTDTRPLVLDVTLASVRMPAVEIEFSVSWEQRMQFQIGSRYTMTLTPESEP